MIRDMAQPVLAKGGIITQPAWVEGKGLKIARGFASNADGTKYATLDVFVESHQGKHAKGDWRYKDKQGTMFREDLVSRTNLQFLQVIAFCIDYHKVYLTKTGKNLFFKFPDFAVDKDSKIHGVKAQVSHEIKGKETFFAFHCYPDAYVDTINSTNPDVVEIRRTGYQKNIELMSQNTLTLP